MQGRFGGLAATVEYQMKKLLFATLALALFAPAGAAFADDYGYRRSHRDDHREHRHFHRDAAREHRDAHEDGFYSRREHRRWHRDYAEDHDDFHDDHPNTRHDHRRSYRGSYGYQPYGYGYAPAYRYDDRW